MKTFASIFRRSKTGGRERPDETISRKSKPAGR
jgi:hypothetical protein